MPDSKSASSAILRLAERAACGDEIAFAKMFKLFRPHLRQFIELRLDRRVRHRIDPSDVLQETQIEIHQRLADFLERRPMPLRVWMRLTAREQLIRVHERHLQANRRSVAREARLSERSSLLLADRFTASDKSPSHQAREAERAKIVAKAIAQLSEMDREILIIRNVEQLKFDEIAFSLEITPAAARKRFGRALIRLQEQLHAFDLGEVFD